MGGLYIRSLRIGRLIYTEFKEGGLYIRSLRFGRFIYTEFKDGRLIYTEFKVWEAYIYGV